MRMPVYLYLNDAKKQILLKMQSMLIIEHNVWISQVRKIAPLQILRLEKKKKKKNTLNSGLEENHELEIYIMSCRHCFSMPGVLILKCT